MFLEAQFLLPLSFFLGSLPFGWMIAKLWGVPDIRKVGSANVGATNVVRTIGFLPGALTFILDFLKGYLPMVLFQCTGDVCGDSNIWVGFAGVCGHCFSPFLSFKGGKGVSTTLAVFLALNPWIGFVCMLTYVLVLLVLKVSALGSLYAMFAGLTGVLLFIPSPLEKIVVFIIVCIVLHKHRENWEKLLEHI